LSSTTGEKSDEQLLSACRRGDEGAWEALVLRYQRLVYAVPRRAGLDEDAAAEVFQEVFATLLESLPRLERPDRLHAWLVTTAKRKRQHLVRAALSRMDERCRALLTMLFYRDEPPPYAEVAAALGVPEGSVGPTRARCLKKLLGLLNKEGFS
jgi:DNA-directed RNA polymerase specialized sigma24 family protein